MRFQFFPTLVLMVSATASDWPMFRGVNGSGVADVTSVPTEFGPNKNVVWKTALPFGHSSPVIASDLIFLTGAEGGERMDAGRGDKVIDKGGKLFTFCLDRKKFEDSFETDIYEYFEGIWKALEEFEFVEVDRKSVV